MIMTIANHRSTVHQVRKSGTYRDSKYIFNYWMETTREGMSNTTLVEIGGMGYIYSTNSIPRTRKTEKKSMEPENSYQKLIAKYPALKARKKRDVAKKQNK